MASLSTEKETLVKFRVVIWHYEGDLAKNPYNTLEFKEIKHAVAEVINRLQNVTSTKFLDPLSIYTEIYAKKFRAKEVEERGDRFIETRQNAMEFVLTELLKNSMDAALRSRMDKTSVDFSIQTEGAFILFSAIDHSGGIRAASSDEVRFFSADGLGLACSKEALQKYGFCFAEMPDATGCRTSFYLNTPTELLLPKAALSALIPKQLSRSIMLGACPLPEFVYSSKFNVLNGNGQVWEHNGLKSFSFRAREIRYLQNYQELIDKMGITHSIDTHKYSTREYWISIKDFDFSVLLKKLEDLNNVYPIYFVLEKVVDANCFTLKHYGHDKVLECVITHYLDGEDEVSSETFVADRLAIAQALPPAVPAVYRDSPIVAKGSNAQVQMVADITRLFLRGSKTYAERFYKDFFKEIKKSCHADALRGLINGCDAAAEENVCQILTILLKYRDALTIDLKPAITLASEKQLLQVVQLLNNATTLSEVKGSAPTDVSARQP